MDSTLLMTLLVASSVAILFIGLAVLWQSRSAQIAVRLSQLPAPRLPAAAEEPGGASLRLKPGRFSSLLTSGSAPDLATALARADLHLEPAEWILINLGTMVLGFVIAFVLLFQTLPQMILLVAMMIGGVLGWIAPRIYLSYLQGKRLNAFEKQLGDTITLLANSLRSGYSLLQSMETVSREIAPPMGDEFGRVVREVGLGLQVPRAMRNMLRRVPSDDLDFLITAVDIQYEVGGNLAQVLDTIAHTIRERIRIFGEIRVLTAQQRLSSLILTLLPVGIGLFLLATNPGYLSLLWQTSCGLIMLGTSAVSIFIGYLVIQKIANIKV